MEDKKNLKVVPGDGSDLNISPVYDHTDAETPKTNKPKNIVIPKELKEKKNDNNKNDEK